MRFNPIPIFRSHPLLPGGHVQTLAGALLPCRGSAEHAVQHRVILPDGDALILHDDCPTEWKPGRPVALLMHGLAGCHQSGYMIRVSRRLFECGIRAIRLDLRGSGAGAGLARRPYHAGCSDDLSHVVQYVETLCPGAPIRPIGFSLSGNILLKSLGESPQGLPAVVDRAMAINPPIDLLGCVRELDRFFNRFYDRRFVAQLQACLPHRRQCFPDVTMPDLNPRPKRLYDFDDRYTASVAGFENAAEYYSRSSARQFICGITVPTLILTSRDDPLVPVTCFEGLRFPDSVRLHIAEGGGHLGYLARQGSDPDRRWMDWRIVDWVSDSGRGGSS